MRARAMASARADALSGANTLDKPVFRLRRLRTRGSRSRRNAGTWLPLRAMDETGSEHGASPWERPCGRKRLASQEAFVGVAAAIEAAAAASDLV